jgi:hypothetical protein
LAQYSHIDDSREATAPAPVVVDHPSYRLLIDSAKGTIVSFRSSYGAGRELLVPAHPNLPLFKIELMDSHFAGIESRSATLRQLNEGWHFN